MTFQLLGVRFSCAVVLCLQLSCSGARSPSATTAAKPVGPSSTVPAPIAAKATDPVSLRAAALRDAAELLDKAGKALQSGNRNLADQLFSSAEIISGPEAISSLAQMFRAGAPPRVTTATTVFDPGSKPQPVTFGNSEQEDAEENLEPPKIEGSLSGLVSVTGTSTGSVGLVTLNPIGRKGVRRAPKRRVIEQRGREFAPRLTAISVGSTIAFPNFDTVFHNVFSSSAVNPFDLGLYRSGEAREFTFNKEGVIRVACNLHANMSAYIAVVAAPHYTVTDADGRFEFRHLMPGKYKLSVWNERSKEPLVQDITIKVGKNQLNLEVRNDAATGPAPDKFGGKRG